jgi:hypothetical protein
MVQREANQLLPQLLLLHWPPQLLMLHSFDHLIQQIQLLAAQTRILYVVAKH